MRRYPVSQDFALYWNSTAFFVIWKLKLCHTRMPKTWENILSVIFHWVRPDTCYCREFIQAGWVEQNHSSPAPLMFKLPWNTALKLAHRWKPIEGHPHLTPVRAFKQKWGLWPCITTFYHVTKVLYSGHVATPKRVPFTDKGTDTDCPRETNWQICFLVQKMPKNLFMLKWQSPKRKHIRRKALSRSNMAERHVRGIMIPKT